MDYLCDSINALFKSLLFLDSLKLADATPIHKKGMKELKEDYRSVSTLLTLSKMFERIMFVQISASFDNAFSNYQCVGKGKDFGAFLTDLSKVFDCLDHKLLIYKLNF